jgi:hypothetical protein
MFDSFLDWLGDSCFGVKTDCRQAFFWGGGGCFASSSRVREEFLEGLTLEDVTDRLPRNICN